MARAEAGLNGASTPLQRPFAITPILATAGFQLFGGAAEFLGPVTDFVFFVDVHPLRILGRVSTYHQP